MMEMSPSLQELGVGGIFAIMMVREVLTPAFKFLQRRNGNGNGYSSTEMLESRLVAILEGQAEILKEIRASQIRQQETLNDLVYRAESIREDVKAVQRGRLGLAN